MITQCIFRTFGRQRVQLTIRRPVSSLTNFSAVGFGSRIIFYKKSSIPSGAQVMMLVDLPVSFLPCIIKYRRKTIGLHDRVVPVQHLLHEMEYGIGRVINIIIQPPAFTAAELVGPGQAGTASRVIPAFDPYTGFHTMIIVPAVDLRNFRIMLVAYFPRFHPHSLFFAMLVFPRLCKNKNSPQEQEQQKQNVDLLFKHRSIIIHPELKVTGQSAVCCRL